MRVQPSIQFTVLLFLFTFQSRAQQVVHFVQGTPSVEIGAQISVLVDEEASLNIEDVVHSNQFGPTATKVPNLGVSKAAFWLEVSILNESNSPLLYLEIELPTIDSVGFYSNSGNGYMRTAQSGVMQPLSQQIFRHQNPVFPIQLNKGQQGTYYIRVISGKQLQLPMRISTPTALYVKHTSKDLIFGLYAGVIIVMLLYNLFIFISIRDRGYFLYVLYILIVGLTQADFQGYTYRYLWPEWGWLASHATYFLSALVGIAAVLFMRVFINTRKFTPTWHKVLNFFLGIYVICMLLGVVGLEQASYQLVQINAMLTATAMIIVAVKVARKKYRPAYFFLLAWSIFLVGVMVFVLKDLGILPYNQITYYTMPFGSAIEVVLLSFGLADRINTLKKEKEASQAETLRAAKENEKILQAQAQTLEVKVKERTHALENSNKELNRTFYDLKKAQSQLVNSEKMASIGQLTAGIAHEINNPINFVTSNVKPLKRNLAELISVFRTYEELDVNKDISPQLAKIEALKEKLETEVLIEEIEEILESIDEGASRTAEIVKGLRNFSRLDEDALKPADVNDGIRSTVALLSPNLKDKIKVELDLGDIPKIECYPGKLNQVFMNMISNAAQAIHQKNGAVEGRIELSTKLAGKNVSILIKDNGIGMEKEVLEKLFDPFFTTKDVGEGTGLGMSISLGIIEDHNGKIEVHSKPGEGSEFRLTIPIKQK